MTTALVRLRGAETQSIRAMPSASRDDLARPTSAKRTPEPLHGWK